MLWTAATAAITPSATNDSKETKVTLDVTLENAIERSVYEIIKENATLAIPQMAERLSVNGRTVQRAINLLKEKGIIVRNGGKRYGHWEIIRNVQDE